jgi:hypothetical protein
MNFLFLELSLMFLLFLAAYNEIKFIYLSNNKDMNNYENDLNINFIDNTVHSVFSVGETTAFLYPISILLSITTLLVFTHVYHLEYLFLNQFILVTGIIVSAQIIIPYYFFYLKKKEESIIHGFNFKEWLRISTKAIKREKAEELTAKDIIELIELTSNIEIHTKNTYKNYLNNLTCSAAQQGEKYALTESEYFEFIPFFNKSNNFIKIKEYFYEISDNDISLISIGYTSMHFSIFSEINLKRLIFVRYLEIISFFFIINLIIFFGGHK